MDVFSGVGEIKQLHRFKKVQSVFCLLVLVLVLVLSLEINFNHGNEMGQNAA